MLAAIVVTITAVMMTTAVVTVCFFKIFIGTTIAHSYHESNRYLVCLFCHCCSFHVILHIYFECMAVILMAVMIMIIITIIIMGLHSTIYAASACHCQYCGYGDTYHFRCGSLFFVDFHYC